MKKQNKVIGITAAFLLCVTVVLWIPYRTREAGKKNTEAEEIKEEAAEEREEAAPLMYCSDTPKSECKLCNGGKDTLLELYLGQKNIGIISLNSFELNDIELNPYDEEGNPQKEISASDSTENCSHGEGAFSVYFSENQRRGYASGLITLREDETLDPEKAASFLCEDCLNGIMDECWHREEAYGIGVIDFCTGKVRLLEPAVKAFSFGDFYVSCTTVIREEPDGKQVEFLTFYCPERG